MQNRANPRFEGRGPRQPPASAPWPPDYLGGGYFDKEGCLFANLATTTAEQVAQCLVSGGVTTNQLRRFYTKAKAVEQRLDAGVEKFACAKADILELKQHAANAVGRAKDQREKAGLELLKQFIDKNVELAVKEEKAFRKGFLLHFQGVVAFFTYHKKPRG